MRPRDEVLNDPMLETDHRNNVGSDQRPQDVPHDGGRTDDVQRPLQLPLVLEMAVQALRVVADMVLR